MYKSAAWLSGYKSVFYKLGLAKEDPELDYALQGHTKAPVSKMPEPPIGKMPEPKDQKKLNRPITGLIGVRG